MRIREIGKEFKKVEIYAKCEFFNPGGSVKDRPASRMITEAIRSGELTKDKTIMDPTSGNTGIAYAMIGAALGYSVELVVPGNVSERRKEVALAFGANLTFSSEMEGSDGAIRLARKLKEENSKKIFHARSIQQSLQSPGPFRYHGGGDLESNRETRPAISSPASAPAER